MAFNGTDHVVVWAELATGSGWDVHGRRVSPAGVLQGTSSTAISTAAGSQQFPAVAFGGGTSLAVWSDGRAGGALDVYGARMSAAGAVLDPAAFPISIETNTQQRPAVAFDGTNYLVVWSDSRGGALDIYGARVSGDGTLLDVAGIAVCTAPGDQSTPTVTWGGGSYLVVWQDLRNAHPDIYGARVSASGALLDGSGIPVSTAANVQEAPAVAFNGAHYVVVWQDYRDGSAWGVYASRVSASGAVMDAAGVRMGTSGSQRRPALACDGVNCLVVWDFTNGADVDIHGGWLSAEGQVQMLTSIAASADPEHLPAISYGNDGSYLVVWVSQRNPVPELHGARVTNANALLEPAGFLISSGQGVRLHPRVAFDGTQHVVVWKDQRSGEWDIYGARVKPSGTVLDPSGLAIATGTVRKELPAIASDGAGGSIVLYQHSDPTSGAVRIRGRILSLQPFLLTVSRSGEGSGVVTSTPSGIHCGSTCTANFDDGALVTLTATADVGSAFVGWSGGCSGTGPCSVMMTGAAGVNALFEPLPPPDAGIAPVDAGSPPVDAGAEPVDAGTGPTDAGMGPTDAGTGLYTLQVGHFGSGEGAVLVSPAGTTCSAGCSASFPAGTAITLTATPGASSTFIGWLGGCSGTGTCNLVMDAQRSAWAWFEPTDYPLSVQKQGDGGGAVASTPAGIDCGSSCTARFARDSTVTLTATPDAASDLIGWGGACTVSGANCTVTMARAHEVKAYFKPKRYPLTVILQGAGGGAVTSSPAGISCGGDCTADFLRGELVTLTTGEDANSWFAGWTGACSGTSLTCSVTVAAALWVGARFEPKTYTLTVGKLGLGAGTVESSPAGIDCGEGCSAAYPHGTVVNLTATPGPTADFVGWTQASCGTQLTCPVTLTAARSVSARFEPKTYVLTVEKPLDGGGTVTSSPAAIHCGPTCSAAVARDLLVTLTATPDALSDFVGWGGTCSGTKSTCTVSMASNRSAKAWFKPKKYPLSILLSGAGSGVVTSAPAGLSCGAGGPCTAEFDRSSTVTLTAAPAGTSQFKGWSGACSGTSLSCTVTIGAAVTVGASFLP